MKKNTYEQMMFIIAKHHSSGISEKDIAFATGVSLSTIKLMLDEALIAQQVEIAPSIGTYRTKLQLIYQDKQLKKIDSRLFQLYEILQFSPQGKRKEELISLLKCTEKELETLLLPELSKDFIVEENDDYLRYRATLEQKVGSLVSYQKQEWKYSFLEKKRVIFVILVVLLLSIFYF